MKRKNILSMLALLVALAIPAAAQQQPTLSVGYFVEVEPGKAIEFENALKQHLQWLGQQGETWIWNTWIRAIGEDLTVYFIVSPGHSFQDLDARASFQAQNRQRWLANVAQFTKSISSRLSITRPDISRPPDGPFSMVWVFSTHVRPGKEAEYEHAVKKVHEAIGKTSWPIKYLFTQTIVGGTGTAYSLVLPGSSWSDFAPPAKSFEAMLEEAHGREGARQIMEIFGRSEESAGSWVYIHRPDLSYAPPQP